MLRRRTFFHSGYAAQLAFNAYLILAVGIGVFGGLAADIVLERWLEKRQGIRVLKLLKLELEVNLTIIRDTIRPVLIKMSVPYAHLELGIWEAVSNKIDLITNDKTLQSIAKAYYQFSTLENALESYESNATAYESESDLRVKGGLLKRVKANRDTILEHLREPKTGASWTVISFTNEAIRDIDSEIKRLDC
jgi:hypothetical protein